MTLQEMIARRRQLTETTRRKEETDGGGQAELTVSSARLTMRRGHR
ncbi:MAG: hypothetical protein ACLUOI_13695 [Eisenbergiella sp.]